MGHRPPRRVPLQPAHGRAIRDHGQPPVDRAHRTVPPPPFPWIRVVPERSRRVIRGDDAPPAAATAEHVRATALPARVTQKANGCHG